jgi:hypothetical protein
VGSTTSSALPQERSAELIRLLDQPTAACRLIAPPHAHHTKIATPEFLPSASVGGITGDFYNRRRFLPECLKLVEAALVDRMSDRNFRLLLAPLVAGKRVAAGLIVTA